MKHKKKYAIGGIMLGVNSLLGLGQALGQRKAQKEAALKSMGSALSNRMTQDEFELEEFPEEGYDMESYYQAYGGKLAKKASGGNLVPISSDMVDVVGPKHSQGGVKLGANEVEGGETIKDGERVYSDQLEVEPGVTYADKAKEYATMKGRLEEALMSGDSITAGTAKRKAQIIDVKEDALFNKQETSKMGMGGKMKYVDGGFMKNIVPYADNILNMGLSLLTPKVPKPNLVKPRKLDTNVNVKPQLNEVDRAVSGATKTILSNTNNSAVARNAISRTKLQGAGQKAGILANKENRETTLRNQNQFLQERTDRVNTGIMNRYNDQNMARSSAILSNISQNIANASDDFINAENFKSQKEFQNNQLAAILASSDYGVGPRLMEIYERLSKRLNKG